MSRHNTSKGFANISVKICKYVIMVVIIIVCATAAYNFGTNIFDSQGVDEKPGTDMSVSVEEGTTISMLADTLKSIKPGTYTFNTSQSGEEIFTVIKDGPEEDKAENTQKK